MTMEVSVEAAQFIAIEGIDGSGTTTQARMLADWLRLRGEKVVCTSEPTDSPAGRLVKAMLRESARPDEVTLAFLFAADRREHLNSTILPALEKGEWVVTDRYLLSSVAYQSRGAPFEWVCELNKLFLRPAVTVLIDVAVEVALARVGRRGKEREYYEDEETLRRVRENFLRAAAAGLELTGPVKVVDGSGDEGRVRERVEKAVLEALKGGSP